MKRYFPKEYALHKLTGTLEDAREEAREEFRDRTDPTNKYIYRCYPGKTKPQIGDTWGVGGKLVREISRKEYIDRTGDILHIFFFGEHDSCWEIDLDAED